MTFCPPVNCCLQMTEANQLDKLLPIKQAVVTQMNRLLQAAAVTFQVGFPYFVAVPKYVSNQPSSQHFRLASSFLLVPSLFSALFRSSGLTTTLSQPATSAGTYGTSPPQPMGGEVGLGSAGSGRHSFIHIHSSSILVIYILLLGSIHQLFNVLH